MLSTSTTQRKGATAQKKQLPVPKGKLANAEWARSYTHPTFTLKQVRDCVPAHCFKRDTLRSLSHVFIDLTMVSILASGALHISVLPPVAQPFAWVAYWICQGVVCTGLWVLAHGMNS
jgi:omega-6 fatty acid desaturase (delta-12 desaturase)